LDLLKPFIEIERRRVAKAVPKADLFVAAFSPRELLTMCRVFRYRGCPLALNPKKLASIGEFVDNNPNTAFPSAITLICPDCEVAETTNGPRLRIPYRYASLNLIDGQHRLFAYAQTGVKDAVRECARLLAVLIKFDETNPTKVSRYAAQAFVTMHPNRVDSG
jgi:hypothetical protein